MLTAACSGGGTISAVKANSTTRPTPSHSPAVLAITPSNGSQDVRPATGITVTAAHGKVQNVTVHTSGDAVSGSLSANSTKWQSTWALNVATSYTVTATGTDSAGKSVTATSTFRTLSPSQTITTMITQGYNTIYGVGQPLQLTFSQPITREATVERALELQTSQPVTGAWYWIDNQHADFRPRSYWPAYTTVSFTGHLNGVEGAKDAYGAADLTQTFKIGRSLIVVASTATHHLNLYRDGKLFHTWPISTGQAGDDTPDGTFLTLDKGNPVEMKPADISPGAPGYYDVQVAWSVRITWSGDYLHSAPWSVGSQGSTNVSHGCVNMPPAAAQQYYGLEKPGDPVTVTGSPVAGTPGDGTTDWFLSWSQLLKGSATGQAVQANQQGSTFVDASTLPASTATTPLGTSAANNARAA
jgi:lipoprotein-anchoring transpeptidase ErfK/SrfK